MANLRESPEIGFVLTSPNHGRDAPIHGGSSSRECVPKRRITCLWRAASFGARPRIGYVLVQKYGQDRSLAVAALLQDLPVFQPLAGRVGPPKLGSFLEKVLARPLPCGRGSAPAPSCFQALADGTGLKIWLRFLPFRMSSPEARNWLLPEISARPCRISHLRLAKESRSEGRRGRYFHRRG